MLLAIGCTPIVIGLKSNQRFAQGLEIKMVVNFLWVLFQVIDDLYYATFPTSDWVSSQEHVK